MQLLCTLRDHCRQGPRNTRYQADATPYLDRSFTGWIAPACGWRTHSITSSARVSSVGGTVMPSNCEQQAYHWRSPSWAKYTIVNIRWKRTQRDFSGNLLKTAKIKGSINSTPLTFHK